MPPRESDPPCFPPRPRMSPLLPPSSPRFAACVIPAGGPYHAGVFDVLLPVWRNGRRDRLKICFPQGSGGSSPSTGTTLKNREKSRFCFSDLNPRTPGRGEPVEDPTVEDQNMSCDPWPTNVVDPEDCIDWKAEFPQLALAALPDGDASEMVLNSGSSPHPPSTVSGLKTSRGEEVSYSSPPWNAYIQFNRSSDSGRNRPSQNG